MKKRGGFKITSEMLKILLFEHLDVEIINIKYDPYREIAKLILIGDDLPDRCSIVEGEEMPELKLTGSFSGTETKLI